jgi:hypothetical protein
LPVLSVSVYKTAGPWAYWSTRVSDSATNISS